MLQTAPFRPNTVAMAKRVGNGRATCQAIYRQPGSRPPIRGTRFAERAGLPPRAAPCAIEISTAWLP